jgi:hypothetical protein
VYNIDQPAAVQFVTGVNGWAYNIIQGGAEIFGADGAFGENTSQFTELSQLWLTYRLDKVVLRLTANNPGAGNQSGIISVRDPGGTTEPYQLGSEALINYYSRLKDAKLCKPNAECTMMQDYRGLLM